MTLPDYCRLEALATAFPSLECLHETYGVKQAQSIAANGFHFKHNGATARRFNAPESLIKYDPVAVFATPGEMHRQLNPGDPYVKFVLSDQATILVHDLPFAEIKKALYADLSVTSAVDFTQKLKALGVDAICHKAQQTEVIVVNPGLIRVTEIGLFNERVLELPEPKSEASGLNR